MAKKKQIYENDFIPRVQFYANCTAVGCRRGYTAQTKVTAGHHCICGVKMTWNDCDSKEKPTFVSFKRIR